MDKLFQVDFIDKRRRLIVNKRSFQEFTRAYVNGIDGALHATKNFLPLNLIYSISLYILLFVFKFNFIYSIETIFMDLVF